MGDLKTDVHTLLGPRGRKLSGEDSGDLKTGAQSSLGPGELSERLQGNWWIKRLDHHPDHLLVNEVVVDRV